MALRTPPEDEDEFDDEDDCVNDMNHPGTPR